MKKLTEYFLITVMGVTPVLAGDYDQALEENRATVREFMQTLKQDLQGGMQAGGPVNAISVCNLSAPGIANTYSARTGWVVSRTSLKPRNSDNAPDPWERSVLESFEQRKLAGEDPATMEFHEVVESKEGRELRYMKAIPTGELCLACHGEQVDSIVKMRLEKLYPHDMAMDYQLGDIRGAFSITQPLDASDK